MISLQTIDIYSSKSAGSRIPVRDLHLKILWLC